MAEVFKNEQTENPHCSKARLQTDKKGKTGEKKEIKKHDQLYPKYSFSLKFNCCCAPIEVLLIKMLQSRTSLEKNYYKSSGFYF